MTQYGHIILRTAAVTGFIAVTLLLACSCKGGTATGGKKTATAAGKAGTERFWPYFDGTYPMVVTDDEARIEYFCSHSWDEFDFSDTLSLSRDTFNVLSGFAGFVQSLNMLDNPEMARGIMRSLMSRASESEKMMEWIVWQAREVLADPNSPVRNSELFMPVVEAQLGSGFYSYADSLRLRYTLDLLMQNRPGQRANDFVYTVISGRRYSLYEIKSQYTLLFFNNPGCPMCRQVREELLRSQTVCGMVREGSLTVLAMYPDPELDEWTAHHDEIPTEWTNAYDSDTAIRRRRLYDVNAIPSLYLLDRNKTVLLKDVTDVSLVEQILAGR